MKFKLVLASLAVALVIFGFTSKNQGEKDNAPKAKVGINVGQIAPEIELINLDGKKMKLSDFRGKMVLIDFWASWCRPCRMENPHVVKAYKEYEKKNFKNGKGFVVYGISLDRNKGAWQAAVKQDKLTWKSNFLGNNTVAKQYEIQYIPSNLLIDGDGKILAKNLTRGKLEPFLKAQLK